MKALPLLAAASLLVNAGLATLILIGGGSPALEPTDPAAEAQRATPPRAAERTTDPESWSKLPRADLPGLVARLQEEGFPPHVLRAIIAGQLLESYRSKVEALEAATKDVPFWQNPHLDPERQRALRTLYRDQQKQLEALLGPDPERTSMAGVLRGTRLDSVPPDKRPDVERVLAEFEDRRMDVSSESLTPQEYFTQIEAVEAARREALGQVLTPAELLEFDLRNSDTARQLRSSLSAFSPSEEEFRAIFALQSGFDREHRRSMFNATPEVMRKRSDAQRELREQITATLGPVRGAEYTRTTDPFYRQTHLLVSRLQLPSETTAQIWSVKQDIQQRAVELRRDTSLPAPERSQRLAALAQEASQKIAPLVGGERGFEAYRQYGGTWMRSLSPPPPTGR